jgi:hypothetical protein
MSYPCRRHSARPCPDSVPETHLVGLSVATIKSKHTHYSMRQLLVRCGVLGPGSARSTRPIRWSRAKGRLLVSLGDVLDVAGVRPAEGRP